MATLCALLPSHGPARSSLQTFCLFNLPLSPLPPLVRCTSIKRAQSPRPRPDLNQSMWSRSASRALATFQEETIAKKSPGHTNGCHRFLFCCPSRLLLRRDSVGIKRFYSHHLSKKAFNKRNNTSLRAGFHTRTITTTATAAVSTLTSGSTSLDSKPTSSSSVSTRIKTMSVSTQSTDTQHHPQSLKTQHLHETNQTYVCPPETAPHIGTILGYPSRSSTLRDLYNATCSEIIDLAATISPFESVRLHVRSEDLRQAQTELEQRMRDFSSTQKARITLVECPTNHCWVRDTGPVYVRGAEDGLRYAVDFRFCEWGNKIGENHSFYVDNSNVEEDDDDWPILDAEARKENAAFAQRVLELENLSQQTQSQPQTQSHTRPLVTRIISPIRLEGGGIEVDGEGTFMATKSSIIGRARNAGISRTEIEAALRRLLGIQKFIWFPGRVGLDITDCHVDAEARFMKPGVVVLARPHESTTDKVSWDMYKEIRSVLEKSTDARGRRFDIYDISDPYPDTVRGYLPGEEEMPAASYVNFYFVNGGLVVPAFGDEVADANAVDTLKKLLPEREIRQVSVNALPRTGGVLHCVTQQMM